MFGYVKMGRKVIKAIKVVFWSDKRSVYFYNIEFVAMGSGQSDMSLIGTQRGEGYRIMKVKPNSPLDKKVDVLFDFIIDAIP